MNRNHSWSVIPGDIVSLIADKISLIEDYVRLCAVCRNWHLFASDHYSLKKKFEFAPVFMLREDPKLGKRNKRRKENAPPPKRTFKSDISGKSYSIDLPEAAGRRCWGSQFGWIVTFGAADLKFSLLNPFSRATIPLPSIRTLLPDFSGGCYSPNRRFIKAILTASPDSPECLVFLLTRPSKKESVLGFAKPGSDCPVWSRFEGPGDLNDVVYFKGSYYGCRRDSLDVVLIDIKLEPPRAVEFSLLPLVPGDQTSMGCYRCSSAFEVAGDLLVFVYTFKYLVNLRGELGLVFRYAAGNSSYYFKIFKIDVNTKQWNRVFPLGENRCLFLGNNSTFMFEGAKNLKSNVIYFTQDQDNNKYRPVDEGRFDMFEGKSERHDHNKSVMNTSVMNPSFWITPHLQFDVTSPSG